ncbi:MAG: dihydrolipoamide acetyltransferase family protein [Rhodoluna sp.]|nr:dihydrolipoamide acetyltransferase family protein [Rhodoluna sp.]
MSKIAYFNLPDVGEGLTEAEIVSWKVKPGDTVSVNQVIVEIETAKSLVELPCPFAGVISELMAAEGDTVEVGKPLISATVADDAVGATVAQAETAAAVHQAVADVASTAAAAEERTPNLVGYGVADPNGPVRRKRAASSLGTNTSSISVVPGHLAVPTHPETQVLAKPPIRKLAADLGVDLSKVTPTGLNGDITREDVMGMAQQASVFRNLSTPAAPTAREERIPVKGVRKAIANAMVSSAFTAPHVSIFVDVDATRTMEYVKRLKVSTDFAGTKVTPLLIMAKAMMWAVRRNPMVNATFTAEEIIVHNFVNFGIAAATPRGLIVPNIKDADQMSMLELAQAIEQLAATAREGKTSPADMKDGTITITNIGVFGVDTGTPILNPGEVAIVALGSIRPKPWVVNNEIQVRQVTTIGATFDHRVVDGDVASRFVQDVASVIEEPALLLD